jgi:hypothetical protein
MNKNSLLKGGNCPVLCLCENKLPPQPMESDGQDTLEKLEILIDSKDGKITSDADSANEEIGIGPLKAFATRKVVKVGGLLEICGDGW